MQVRKQKGIMSDWDVVIAVSTAITAIATAVTVYYLKKDREPEFLYEKFPEGQIWKIRILHPNKLIRKCSVSLDGKPLSLSRLQDCIECAIEVGGGENFVIPMGSWKEESEILIKYDKHEIKKKFSEIPIATR